MSHKQKIGGLVISLVALLSAFVFLFVGFTEGIWSPTWLVFLSIPFVSIIVDVITKKKDPVGMVSGIVSFACIVGYLCFGFFFDLWHPGWLIFFAIPVSSIIAKMFVSADGGKDEAEDGKSQEQ